MPETSFVDPCADVEMSGEEKGELWKVNVVASGSEVVPVVEE